MKRWWLTVVLAAIAAGLALWLLLRQDEAGRLVAAYAEDPKLASRVVALGSDAIAPLCEAMERLPASDLSEADTRAMVNYVNALDAIAAGWPYTVNQSMPVLLRTVQRMEDERARSELMDTIGRSFKQVAVPPMLDVLEYEFRMLKADGPQTLPSEAVVSDLLKRLGPARCLPVLEARIETTTSDFRLTLVRLVCGFAPNEHAERILARVLEQEKDPARRERLIETIGRLRKEGKISDSAGFRLKP